MTARTLTAGIFGTLAGLGTLTHGIGELMQGAVPTPGLAFPSWTVGPIAEHLDGDPAMSVLPTMAASGAATTVTSVALLAASAATASGRRGRRAIAPLGGVALLVGGGVGPPILAALAGLAGSGAWQGPVVRLPLGVRRALARSWRPLFAVGVADGIFVVIGSIALTAAFGFHAPDVFLYAFLGGAGLLGLIGAAATASDLAEAGASGATVPGHRIATAQAPARRRGIRHRLAAAASGASPAQSTGRAAPRRRPTS